MSKKDEALKLALEALREIERLPGISSANLYARRALKEMEALAEQPAQQEHVAWFELLREARDNCKASIVEEGISASRKEYRIDLEARLTAALNTSPQPSKPWVGLTPEERQACTQSPFTSENYLAIEAKLKEKNA